MTKIYCNVVPRPGYLYLDDIQQKIVYDTVANTPVKIQEGLVFEDVTVALQIQLADILYKILEKHNPDVRVGLIYSPQGAYHGFSLVIETNHQVNPIVNKFYSWEKIESQSLIEFDELADGSLL